MTAIALEPIAKDSQAFRAAYRRSALDLQAARGMERSSLPVQDDGWYLDDRVKALGRRSGPEILGFILYTEAPFFYDDTDAEVLDIWVDSTFRRQGIARELFRAALSDVHGRIGLQVHIENAGSLAFWRHVVKANGWEMTKEMAGDGPEQAWKVIIESAGGRRRR
jgi:ribosomal protein S18 acetylase RimI-like enzyme